MHHIRNEYSVFFGELIQQCTRTLLPVSIRLQFNIYKEKSHAINKKANEEINLRTCHFLHRSSTQLVLMSGEIRRSAIMVFSVLKQILGSRVFKNDRLLGTNLPR
jgi:hypothetical protein